MDWIDVFQSSSKMVDSIVKALADIKTMFEQHWCLWGLVIQKCVESLFILIYLRILFLHLDCVHQYTMSDHYFPEKQKSLATISNLISCICYLYLPGEVFCTQDLYKFMIQGIHKNDILLLLFFKMALALFLFLVLLKSMFLNETCVLIILINQKKVKNV